MRFIFTLLLIFIFNNIYSYRFGITDNSGKTISDTIQLIDMNTDTVLLSDIVNKPTILSLVYFNCEDYCPKVNEGIYELIKNVTLIFGKDYQVISVSINKNEDNNDIFQAAKRYSDFSTGWKFFAADEENINELTKNIGYTIYDNNEQYMHISLLVVLSNKCKIINYMYGYRFLPLDFELTYKHAVKNISRTTVPRDFKYCSNYIAPAHNKLHKMALFFGLFMVISSISLFLRLVYKKKKTNVS